MSNNIPMTLEEVKGLKSGEKVYLKQYKTLIEREVSCVFAGQIVFVNDIRKYCFSNYRKTWLCYRPNECNECKDISMLDKILGFTPKYCPECGRKLHD